MHYFDFHSRTVLLLACGFAVFSAVSDAAVIDLRGAAQVRAGLIRLGDVAELIDPDPLMQRQLQAVSLGPAPAPGRKTRITQQTVRERLLAHGLNLSEIEFSGQALVIVSSPAEPKSASEPKSPAPSQPVAVRPLAANPAKRQKANQVVQTAFHRHYHSSSSDIGSLNLVVEIPEADLPVLLNAAPEFIRFVEPGLEWGGPQILTAHLPQGDGATHIIRMQAWLNETPQILTVKHAVPKGQILKETDFVRVPAKPGDVGVQHPQAVIGHEASRTLRPGMPLQRSDTNKVPLVRTNDLVTVTARSPGLKLTRLFRAAGTGGEGEIVNFVALEDQRDKVQARVTGWHEAEIVSTDADSMSERATPPREPSRRVFPATTEPGGQR